MIPPARTPTGPKNAPAMAPPSAPAQALAARPTFFAAFFALSLPCTVSSIMSTKQPAIAMGAEPRMMDFAAALPSSFLLDAFSSSEATLVAAPRVAARVVSAAVCFKAALMDFWRDKTAERFFAMLIVPPTNAPELPPPLAAAVKRSVAII